ncbi:MAG: phosphomannomutase [Acidaminococcales bacterium]|nr:phosphomannomutase [Acidaminococcales bacterium]
MTKCRSAFKAYDLRGKVPDELNEEMAYRIGRVFAGLLTAKKVVLGRDARLSGESIQNALAEGLTDAGCSVLDIGLCGTEMVYFATTFLKADGGVMVTASHNPKEYNGMKFVREGSRPISSDSGLMEIADRALAGSFTRGAQDGPEKGLVTKVDVMGDYIGHLLSYVDSGALKPLKIVANVGNGCAGAPLEQLERRLPFKFVKLYSQPDGNFPNGVPNPILPRNRAETAAAVKREKADLGVAWDGDYDRCFLFDADGEFIEGYYIVGILAEAFLRKVPGARIIHDPRLIWNTLETVKRLGGEAVECKSGHAFIKEKMRQVDAVYGGEMSAHHYFKDFTYCDSGMLPWLLITELMCVSGKPLSEMVGECIAKFPCSGEINRRVKDGPGVLARIKEKYAGLGKAEEVDGISFEFSKWRFNVRISNTEPVVRLNLETRADRALMEEKTAELLAVIGGEPD